MNSRERFLATMQLQQPDHLPWFEEGIRDEVRLSWERQGLERDADLVDLFRYDTREEIELDLEPRPHTAHWPTSARELGHFESCLRAKDDRLPKNWRERVKNWRSRTFPLILRVQRGFFLSMGVDGWQRFHETLALTKDDPGLVMEVLRLQGELSATLVERLLSQVSVDAALFSEPIGGDHGPLISPKMYADLVLTSYRPILAVLHRFQVPVIIVRTYANSRALLPLLVQAGINCLWAVEAPPEAMDYFHIRREFGKALRLIGGIDTDALRQGRAAIQAEIERIAPLAADGGYIPLLDGRVRDDVGFADYCYYRALLLKIGSVFADSL